MRIRAKSAQFVRMTDKVASQIDCNEELTLATEEARRIMRERRHLSELAESRQSTQAARHKARFQETVTTTRLRDIAAAQASELLYLQAELDRWRKRSFPSFVIAGRAPAPVRTASARRFNEPKPR